MFFHDPHSRTYLQNFSLKISNIFYKNYHADRNCQQTNLGIRFTSTISSNQNLNLAWKFQFSRMDMDIIDIKNISN